MLKLSKKVDYGLIALMHLARFDDSSWSAREIAESYDIPGGLMAKVLQKMGRKGLVASHQGTKGGYTLGRRADQIKAVEVVEVIDGPVSLAQCFSSEGSGSCVQFEKCHLKSPLQRLNDIVIRILGQVSIAQLVGEEFKAVESGMTEDETKLDLLPVVE
jgi:Rrf2 family protein